MKRHAFLIPSKDGYPTRLIIRSRFIDALDEYEKMKQKTPRDHKQPKWLGEVVIDTEKETAE